ncbi:MAG: hypothetical protein L3K09_01125, partial [Thermoplasmata archaeon]|nr:hypothetical protein [Thermoplasmata archaeon]
MSESSTRSAAVVLLLVLLVVATGAPGLATNPRRGPLGGLSIHGSGSADPPVPLVGWTQFAPHRSPPPTAGGASMAWDPVDGYLVLFGGCTSGDFWLSDCQPTNATWTF